MPAEDLLEPARTADELIERRPPPNPLLVRGVDEWKGEPPTVPWLIQRLHLAPGRPLAVVGYAGAGKTFLTADLALAVCGPPDNRDQLPEDGTCWGGVRVDLHGPVVHIDMETGSFMIRYRYHRLAIGRRAHITGWKQLGWTSFPPWSLVLAEAEEMLVQTMKGRVLCIIDSLVMSTPGVDENSARIADALGIIARASERTGCAVVIIHHAGKPQQDGSRELKYEGRGSSSIEGCWGSKWVLRPQDGHLLLEHGKSQWDSLEQPIRCRIENVGQVGADGKSAGVRLVGVEGAAQVAVDDPMPGKPATMAAAKRAVLETLSVYPELNGTKLRSLLSGKSDVKKKAVELLVKEGAIRYREGKGNEFLFSLAPAAQGGTVLDPSALDPEGSDWGHI